jgi:hypothetical protein
MAKRSKPTPPDSRKIFYETVFESRLIFASAGTCRAAVDNLLRAAWRFFRIGHFPAVSG